MAFCRNQRYSTLTVRRNFSRRTAALHSRRMYCSLPHTYSAPIRFSKPYELTCSVDEPDEPTPIPTSADVNPTPIATSADVNPTAVLTSTDVNPTAVLTSTDANPTAVLTSTDANPTAVLTSTDANPTAVLTSTDANPTAVLCAPPQQRRYATALISPPYKNFERLLVRPDTLTSLRISLKRRQWPKELLANNLTPTKILRTLRCKNARLQHTNLHLYAGAHMKPHPMKDLGEDSFFVCDNQMGLGVADGVSEWRNFGVNPRRFADQLMLACKRNIDFAIDASTAQEGGACNICRAKLVLIEAFASVTAYGGSTAALAILDDAGSMLEVANLGDSTVCVFRRDVYSGRRKIIFRSKELQHVFNLPYQLMNIPSLDAVPTLLDTGCYLLADVIMKIHKTDGYTQDTPDDAQCYRVPVVAGDLVVLGTDGVFDNLFEDEICDILSLALSPIEAHICGCQDLVTLPEYISCTIAECAYQRSNDADAIIPFILNAEKAGLMKGQTRKQGGKQDDITVAVAWVV